MLDEITLAALTRPDQAGAATVHAAQADRQPPAQPEHNDPELPGWMWRAMFACYGVFFAGLIAAAGHSIEAGFMLAISIGYTAMYFGTAVILIAQKPAPRRSLFALGLGPLSTYTGPMSTAAVASQVLTIPMCLALFGVSIAVIRFAVG
jgi:hypothetical protein